MLKPYLVIKLHRGDYIYKLFTNLPDANAAVNPTEDFPGDYLCAYNLEADRYVQVEPFPGGINNNINDIVQQCKIDYKNAQL